MVEKNAHKCNNTISNETHIIFIYGIKNMKNVKCRPHSYNTKQNILVCGLFFILLNNIEKDNLKR